jgi:uncharacterized protein YecT (DUF1311 family)
MKEYLFAVAIAGAILSSAIARPQLHTASVGWINPGSIFCEVTSDHICTVKNVPSVPLANTFTSQHGDQIKYQVPAGTDLVIVNQGDKNEPSVNDEKNEYVFPTRVEVAIVIPADWGKDGNLHPLKPCNLSYKGNIVSLACARAQGQGGASFNCNIAQRPDEVLICQSDELSALDRQMSSIYFQIRNGLSGSAREQLEAGQARWLRSRMQCGGDFGCIQSTYRERIDALNRFGSIR